MICTKCGKDIPTSGLCTCQTISGVVNLTPIVGWVCPNCKTGVSPFQTHCPLCLSQEARFRIFTTGGAGTP